MGDAWYFFSARFPGTLIMGVGVVGLGAVDIGYDEESRITLVGSRFDSLWRENLMREALLLSKSIINPFP